MHNFGFLSLHPETGTYLRQSHSWPGVMAWDSKAVVLSPLVIPF